MVNMDIEEVLNSYKDKIDDLLQQYLDAKLVQYKDFPEYIKKFVTHVNEFTLRGGKRLRPAIIYQTYKMFSNDDLDEVIKISTFIELIQSFLLIHDDIMDRADLRRGKATVHKIYERVSHGSKFNDDKHFGNTMAVLAGDLACQFAYEIIIKSGFTDEKRNRLIALVSKDVSEVIFGQITDIMLSYAKEFEEEEVLDVHMFKTAVYTFRLPIFVGGILADVDRNTMDALEKYAINCGIAFQIRDDILGVYGNDDNTGKSSSSDIKEGKKTLLVSYVNKYGTQEDKNILNRYLGNFDLTDEEVAKVRNVFTTSGSLDYSIAKCKNYVEKSKKSLQNINVNNNDSMLFFSKLADYMAVRAY